MNRRQLPVDLGVLGLAAPLAGVEAVRQGLTAAVAGDRHAADLDEWDRIVDEYARSYYVTPTDRLLRDLTADLSVLQLRLGGTDGTMQRGLARVRGPSAEGGAGGPTGSLPAGWRPGAPCWPAPGCASATPRRPPTPGWATPAAPTPPRRPPCGSTRRASPASGP